MKRSLTLFALLPFFLFGQSNVDFGRESKGGLSATRRLDIKQIRNEIYESIPDDLRGDVTDRSIMRYANVAAENLSELLEQGLIYTDWPEVDDYLNSVLEVIKNASGHAGMSNIKAYLIKAGHPNAFMTPSGAMFVTVGMLNELEDESNLAGVLAHELAHYTLHHNVEGFVKEVQGDFKPGIFFDANKAASRYSIDNELDADRLASEYLAKSGYSYLGLVKAFELSERIEDKQLLTDGYSYEVKETTHPSSANRLQMLTEASQRVIRKYGDGENFLVDSLTFSTLRASSGVEVLRLLLADYDYRACLEKAFLYHIYDPNNATYVYYLMESIRRMCYFDNDQWREKFIVDAYFEFTQGFGEGYKRRIQDHFFSKFRHRILGIEPTDFKKVRARFYWDGEPRFVTYEQAFQFFFDIGEILEEPECYLSNALSLSFDEEKMNPLLDKYISYNSGKYLDFAKALRAGSVYEDLNDKSLLVFDNFVGLIKQGPDYVVLRNGTEDARLKEEVGKMAEQKDYLYLKDLVVESIEDFSTFRALEQFSILTFITKGNKLKLYELNPDYWMFFKKHGVNRIVFINCLYSDKVKGKYTKEVYLDVADSRLHDYLGNDLLKNRSISVFVTSILMQSDEDIKKQYFDTDIYLEKDRSAYQQLKEIVEKGLESIE